MVNQNAVLRAWPLAQYLSEQFGRRLLPKSNTVLGRLVSQTRRPIQAQQPDLTMFSTPAAFAALVESVTIGQVDCVSEHDATMDASAKFISDQVGAQINVIRTVIAPEVDRYHDLLVTGMAAEPIATVGDIVKLVRWVTPALLENASFLSTVMQHKNVSNQPPAVQTRLPADMDINTYMRCVETEDKWVTEEARALVGTFEESVLCDLWNEHFDYSSELPRAYVRTMEAPAEERIRRLAVVYLWAKYLAEHVVDAKVGLQVYTQQMLQTRDYAGSVLTQGIAQIKVAVDKKILILSKNDSLKTITVLDSVYDEYLDAGGRPEAVLGCALSEDNVSTVAELSKKADYYAQEWSHTRGAFATQSTLKNYNRMRFLAEHHFEEMLMAEPSGLELNFRKEQPNAVGYANELFKKLMAETDITFTNDLAGFALKAVGACRFYFTPGYRFLRYMEMCKQMDAELTAEEAATQATIDYLADFLVNQMQKV